MALSTGNGTLSFLTSNSRLGSTSMNTAVHTNHYPSRSAPTAMSAVVNDTYFRIDAYVESGAGTFKVLSGYTLLNNQTSLSIDHVNMTENGSITLRAVATYPNNVLHWSDGNGGIFVNGNGTSNLDITFNASNFSGATEVYCTFG